MKKKFFALLLCVALLLSLTATVALAADHTLTDGETTYNSASISNSGDNIGLLVVQNGSKYYALNAPQNGSATVSATEVEVDVNSKIADKNGATVWTVTKSTNTYSIKSGDDYLGIDTGNSQFTFGSTPVTDWNWNSGRICIEVEEQAKVNAAKDKVNKKTTTNYGLQLGSGSFGITTTSGDFSQFAFYEETTTGPDPVTVTDVTATYNGNVQLPTVGNAPPGYEVRYCMSDSNTYADWYTKANAESATTLFPKNANTNAYTVYVGLFKEGEKKASVAASVTISKKQITVPTLTQDTFAYDGTAKSLGLTSTDDYTVSGTTSATDKGTYTATLTLKDKTNTEWTSNGTDGIGSDNRTVTWHIVEQYAVSDPQEIYVLLKVGEKFPVTILNDDAQNNTNDFSFATDPATDCCVSITPASVTGVAKNASASFEITADKAGEATVTFSYQKNGAHGQPLHTALTVHVATYEVPDELTATYGDKLSAVDLPTGWAWKTPSSYVGNVGERKANATFDPDGSGTNYDPVTEELTVTVEPKDISDYKLELNVPAGGFVYTGSAIKPTVKRVYKTGETLTLSDDDYDLSYSNNVEVAKSTASKNPPTVTLTAKGNYKGTVKTTFTIGEAALPFVDVVEGSYYYDAVEWAFNNGIVYGIDSTHFAPNRSISRAEAITFIWRAAGSPAASTSAIKFTDVEKGSYYEKAVAWGIAKGIVKGTGKNTFSPNQVCTRAHIVSFLARWAGAADGAKATKFTDVKSSDYFAAAVKWAEYNKVTAGTTATTFSPNQVCTRAQVVVFLYRYLVK